jgi:hypothetical protein
MSSDGQTDNVRRPGRIRFSLASILWLQLLLAPAFLAPVYARGPSGNPYVRLIAVLIAPACYAALLLVIAWRRRPPQSVLSGVRQGAAYGILFGLLSYVPALLYQMSPRLKTDLPEMEDAFLRLGGTEGLFALRMLLATMAPYVLLPLYLLLHYALIGAATGGICSIVRDFLCYRRPNSLLT